MTDKEKRMKERLAGLLLQLDREISCTRVLVDKVSRVERETGDSQQMRSMVMEEMQTKMSDGLVQQQIPHMTPLPSLYRLPSPPPTAEVQTDKKKEREGEREYGRNWKRVRARRVLLEE